MFVEFGRLITAMVTPFDDELQIDWKQVEKLIDYLVDEQQSDALVVCGTTGESPTLEEEEKLELFRFCVNYAKGRCKIIAGTGSNDTKHSLHLSKEAEKLGVDGLLLVAPYYNRPSQEGLFQHFKAIAESVNIPVLLYNVPGRTGVNVTAETTVRLSHVRNVVGTKDCGDSNQLTQIVRDAAPGFRVYTGEDSMTLLTMAVGGYGVISVASHVVGKEMKQMIGAYLNGDVKQAAQLHGQLLPVLQGLFVAPNPVPVKYALNHKGIGVGGVRLPLVEATEEQQQFIRSLFS